MQKKPLRCVLLAVLVFLVALSGCIDREPPVQAQPEPPLAQPEPAKSELAQPEQPKETKVKEASRKKSSKKKAKSARAPKRADVARSS